MTGLLLLTLLGPGFTRLAFLGTPPPVGSLSGQVPSTTSSTPPEGLRMHARMGGAVPSLHMELAPKSFPGTVQVQVEGDPASPLLARARLFRLRWQRNPWAASLGWFPQPSLLGPDQDMEGVALTYRSRIGNLQAFAGHPRSRVVEAYIPLTPGIPGPYPLPPEAALQETPPEFWLRGHRLHPGQIQFSRDRQTVELSPELHLRPGDVLRVVYREAARSSPAWEGGLQWKTAHQEVLVLTRGTAPPSRDTGGYYVGPGAGAYLWNGHHFVYVGPGQGDRAPLFLPVGEGQGAYRYDPLADAVVYAGEGRGNLTVRAAQRTVPGYGARVRLEHPWAGIQGILRERTPQGGIWIGPPSLRFWYAVRDTSGWSEAWTSPLHPSLQEEWVGVQVHPLPALQLKMGRALSTGALQWNLEVRTTPLHLNLLQVPGDTEGILRLGTPGGLWWEEAHTPIGRWRKTGFFLNLPGFQITTGAMDSLPLPVHRGFADLRVQADRGDLALFLREGVPLSGILRYRLGALQGEHLRRRTFARVGPLLSEEPLPTVDTQHLTWAEQHRWRWGHQELQWERIGDRQLLRLHLGDTWTSLEGVRALAPGEVEHRLRLERVVHTALLWMFAREYRFTSDQLLTSGFGLRQTLWRRLTLRVQTERWQGSREGTAWSVGVQWVGRGGMLSFERRWTRGDPLVPLPGWVLQGSIQRSLQWGEMRLRIEGAGVWVEGQPPSPGIRVETLFGSGEGRNR